MSPRPLSTLTYKRSLGPLMKLIWPTWSKHLNHAAPQAGILMSRSPRKRQKLNPAQDLFETSVPDEPRGEGLVGFEEGNGLEDEEAGMPSDTMAALEVLRRQFPQNAQVPPIILRSQIYNVLHDWSLADRELEKERQKGTIRMIKLPASIDDYAYILSEDYMACIGAAASSQREKGTSEDLLSVFDWFRDRVLPNCCEAQIAHRQLLKHLSTPSREKGAHPAVTDQQFSLLMNTGLLTREVGKQNSYLFAVAGAGKLVTSITKGRKEIVAAITRKRYKEVFLKDALKWKVRGSCLDSRWHIRDLLGRGSICEKKTTSGPLLQLASRK